MLKNASQRKVFGVSLETWMSLFMTDIHVSRYIQ